LDDICIATSTFEDHILKLQVMLTRLREALLKLKLKKCVLLSENTRYLGHYFIETDGSSRGLGAVLCQKDKRGHLCPISFASSGLSKSQQSYGPMEVEALACVYAVRHFHTYIFGCAVTILTDHNALTYLLRQVEPIPRLQRWILTLDQYNVNWVYRKGTSNAVADALSRRYGSSEESAKAQSKLIELDSMSDFMQKGKWDKLWVYCWVKAMTTWSTNHEQVEKEPDLVPKISENPKEVGQKKSSESLNTWSEKDAAAIRDSEMSDGDLKFIMVLLDQQS
ncbi:MAG: hypothetical protein GY820_36995, partial [Gammaproteobacteria bacterium]|nr:hypothetical protein [Gammaproteobacteria bacterium]